MKKYFFLGSNILPQTAFAVADDDTKMAHEWALDLSDRTSVPFSFTMKSYLDSGDETEVSDDLSGIQHLWSDYLPNDSAWPIMSKKMNQLIEQHLTGAEGIIWMTVMVKAEKQKIEFYIPRFERKLDVLDLDRSVFVDNDQDMVYKPVFALDKINKYSMFHLPRFLWSITSSLYINEKLKDAIETANLTGVSFGAASVA